MGQWSLLGPTLIEDVPFEQLVVLHHVQDGVCIPNILQRIFGQHYQIGQFPHADASQVLRVTDRFGGLQRCGAKHSRLPRPPLCRAHISQWTWSPCNCSWPPSSSRVGTPGTHPTRTLPVPQASGEFLDKSTQPSSTCPRPRYACRQYPPCGNRG